jgi:hypothetical protein
MINVAIFLTKDWFHLRMGGSRVSKPKSMPNENGGKPLMQKNAIQIISNTFHLLKKCADKKGGPTPGSGAPDLRRFPADPGCAGVEVPTDSMVLSG